MRHLACDATTHALQCFEPAACSLLVMLRQSPAPASGRVSWQKGCSPCFTHPQRRDPLDPWNPTLTCLRSFEFHGPVAAAKARDLCHPAGPLTSSSLCGCGQRVCTLWLGVHTESKFARLSVSDRGSHRQQLHHSRSDTSCGGWRMTQTATASQHRKLQRTEACKALQADKMSLTCWARCSSAQCYDERDGAIMAPHCQTEDSDQHVIFPHFWVRVRSHGVAFIARLGACQ